MTLVETRTGKIKTSDGGVNPERADRTGAIVSVDGHGRYQEAVLQGDVFSLTAAAAAPTAYVGAAAGTPLIAIHNPVGSGNNLVLLSVCIANRAAASAAGVVSFGLWGGASVLPTGTQTPCMNMLSLMATGSVAKGFVNTALTGSTALNLICSCGSYYWATAASAFLSAICTDIGGMIVVVPGNQVAIGATSALTSATWDITLMWEEVPI